MHCSCMRGRGLRPTRLEDQPAQNEENSAKAVFANKLNDESTTVGNDVHLKTPSVDVGFIKNGHISFEFESEFRRLHCL